MLQTNKESMSNYMLSCHHSKYHHSKLIYVYMTFNKEGNITFSPLF